MTYSPEYRRILTRMGYYDYQSRLIYRHLNQAGGWDSHTLHSRDFILRAVNHVNPKIVTVLGSGWLLELPVAELLQIVDRINLVDIVHPPDLVAQAASISKLKLVEQDVSGGLITEVWNGMKGYSFLKKRRTLSGINIPDYDPGFEAGMVISLNILTQLESLPVAFIKKRSTIKEPEYEEFRKRIQEKHIAFLQQHKSVLISDSEEQFVYTDGRTETVCTLLASLPRAGMSEEWQWDYDLKGDESYTRKSIMNVKALLI
jgi:hypothetical protein